MTEETLKKLDEEVQEKLNDKKKKAPRFKIKKVENPNVFRFQEVEIRKPLVSDSITAEMVTGKTEGSEYFLGLIAECCLFDGKKAVYQEIRNMDEDDFFALCEAWDSETESQPAEAES